jgi:outer membrane protein assembly factor BamB
MKSAVVAALIIATATAFPRGEGHARPAYPLPGTFATLRPADALGFITAGGGDAWVDDRWGERLLRLDGRTGSVVASIPVRGRLALTQAAGAVWALQSGGEYGRGLRGPLLRIDPATNRVTARIPLRDLGFGLVARRDSLWVWGPRSLVRVDARAGLVVQAILVGDTRGETTGFALDGDQPLITTADGHLVRFDPRSGEETRVVTLPFTAPALQPVVAGGRRAIITAGGTVAAVDRWTGAVLWSERLGFRVGNVLAADGALWTFGAYLRDPGDRVWKLDPVRGAVLGSVLLPAFGTTGMALLARTLWVTTANGRVLVLRR